MGPPLDDRGPPLDGKGPLPAEVELHALVTAFPDVGFILDASGTYVQVFASEVSESLLYDDPEALLGRSVRDVFDPPMAETFTDNIDAALATGDLQEFEYSLDVGDGERWFEARVTPVSGTTAADAPEGEYVVYVARDVTDRERRRRDLARQRNYMREMLDSLDDLFASTTAPAQLSFQFAGYDVVTRSSGEVELYRVDTVTR